MPFVHGASGVLTVNSGALTGFTNDATLSRTTDTAETTVFGLDDKTFIAGLRDGTFSGSCFYDKTASTGSMAILEAVHAGRAAVPCTYRPAGSGSGQYLYTFSAILTQLDITGSTDSVVSLSISLQATGAIVPTTP